MQLKTFLDAPCELIKTVTLYVCHLYDQDTINQSINQSIKARFVGCHYMTQSGAPTIVSYKHDQKVHS